MTKKELLNYLSEEFKTLGVEFESIFNDDSLSDEDKITMICQDSIEIFKNYLATLELI